MFSTARLRLTLWYLAVLGTIVVLLSVALYEVLLRLQQAEVQALGRVAHHGVARLFADDARVLAIQLGAIDLGMLILAALGAHVLAGRTLRPIQEAMERQERFAVAASHELRTPLTVLQGTLEVALLRDRTPAEYKEILSRAATEAARMGTLVGDLLALARVQSDREILARAPLDLRVVAREAAEGVESLAARKGQRLEVELDGPLPTCGDQLKLRQALTNLLDNAITYTPEGGAIRLSARAARGRAVIAVRDTGPGIEAQHLPHLFEPFYRVDCARGGGSGHTGLGLALAAWIALAHGGHLAVESRIGVGTLFTLTLPLRARTAGFRSLT
ncbi:MAG TPA: ATP-binding protein [Chloroflexota bacterium]|nr:ATP-binding protein [Chloroflexota bacterium]